MGTILEKSVPRLFGVSTLYKVTLHMQIICRDEQHILHSMNHLSHLQVVELDDDNPSVAVAGTTPMIFILHEGKGF